MKKLVCCLAMAAFVAMGSSGYVYCDDGYVAMGEEGIYNRENGYIPYVIEGTNCTIYYNSNDESGTAILCGDANGVVDLVIPSQIEGCSVKIVKQGDMVYYGDTAWSRLESVSFSEGIEQIDKDCFYGATKLNKIELPNTIMAIGDSAFGNTGVEQATIPNSVERIEGRIFSGCESLTNVTITEGDKPVLLDMDIVTGCYNINEIYLPKNVKLDRMPEIHSGIEKIYVDSQNPWFYDIDGVVFAKIDCDDNMGLSSNYSIYKDTLHYYPPARKDGSYTIPEGIVGINAMWYMHPKECYLNQLTIPKEVTYIYMLPQYKSVRYYGATMSGGANIHINNEMDIYVYKGSEAEKRLLLGCLVLLFLMMK